MKIYTGSYKYCKTIKGISISGDRGKNIGFKGIVLSELAPKKEWWQIWYENIGKVNEEDNLEFYVTEYYKTVLSKFHPDDLLHIIPDGSILLCYEEPEDFCHRNIIAGYLELFYDIPVKEIKIIDGKKITQKRNRFYASTKQILERLIKTDINMHGFESIAAAHIYEAALSLEKMPELCEHFPVSSEAYKRLANVLEDNYKDKQKRHNKNL